MLPGEMGVAHRGTEIGVPDRLLHVHWILTVCEPRGHPPMTQVVLAKSWWQTSRLRSSLEPITHGLDPASRFRVAMSPEVMQAQGDGQPELAGSYEVLHPDSWAPLHEQDDDDRIMIFGCDCGVAGCWPLRVRIVRRGTELTWSDFQRQNRDWSYSTLGPFVFVAEQYDRAMRETLSNR
jgi:hypothetical protein